ncbi:MAG: hypothetical protein LBE85_12930, partial [Candidatus Accumulibacter sp.]|nr:hypothetical protein [Accumulibacter sp.]
MLKIQKALFLQDLTFSLRLREIRWKIRRKTSAQQPGDRERMPFAVQEAWVAIRARGDGRSDLPDQGDSHEPP